ncbi:hypothetical protein [Methanobrevibacter sp.]|uniref:hypothetical protein n=1 Tax=Methanobrevibacter sp. TaxID=66852 RepID=UPI0026E0F949|nr:hypothetical protein [Methanobrevibacter sp.]MDO5859988.1 hypothetical protein [Methanobrevibacter sp.]
MDKKWTVIIVMLLVAFVLIVAYIDDNPNAINNTGETMSFNVSSGPSELSESIKNIKTLNYYKGYDAETVKWMESLGNKKVFRGEDSIVIMSSFDAGKIPSEPGITDVYIYDYFTAEVIENHDLGNGLPSVYHVKNVKFTNREIVGNGLA